MQIKLSYMCTVQIDLFIIDFKLTQNPTQIHYTPFNGFDGWIIEFPLSNWEHVRFSINIFAISSVSLMSLIETHNLWALLCIRNIILDKMAIFSFPNAYFPILLWIFSLFISSSLFFWTWILCGDYMASTRFVHFDTDFQRPTQNAMCEQMFEGFHCKPRGELRLKKTENYFQLPDRAKRAVEEE